MVEEDDDEQKGQYEWLAERARRTPDATASQICKLKAAGADWSLSRALENRIGSSQPAAGDFDRAKQHLENHGSKDGETVEDITEFEKVATQICPEQQQVAMQSCGHGR